MKFLAVIPARGGSKGIKKKNIRKFAGKPLIAHAISGALASKFIDRVVVSTESNEIAGVALKYGAEVPFLRPRELAEDKSRVTDAVVHLLNTLRLKESYNPDYIVLLQPTSPLRTSRDIDEVIELALKSKAPAAVTVCATEQLVFTKDDRGVLNLESNSKFLASSNRQELPSTFRFNGSMVYVIRTDVFLAERNFVPEGTVGYEIPRWRSVDLDESQDFVVGELIYKNRKKFRKI